MIASAMPRRRLFAPAIAMLGLSAIPRRSVAIADTRLIGPRQDLVLLAAPISTDPYYADVADAIFDFHVALAEAIAGRDRVLILTDRDAYSDYADVLGADRVAQAPMQDIWTRDFGTSNPDQPVLFRYTAAGQGGGAQGQRDADRVQDDLAVLLEEAGVAIHETDLFNDGGNFVEDGAGNAVVSRKFLRDNNLTEIAGRAVLRDLLGLRAVAFIESDEQGGLEHADGVVAFVDPGVLIVNTYNDDPDYAAELLDDLARGLPGVALHQVVAPYDGTAIHDARFGSACGLYTNALVTPGHVYLPQFGGPDDAIALAQVRAVTTRNVVPLPSDGVCHMGGGIRCLSWQLRGSAAETVLAYLGKTG